MLRFWNSIEAKERWLYNTERRYDSSQEQYRPRATFPMKVSPEEYDMEMADSLDKLLGPNTANDMNGGAHTTTGGDTSNALQQRSKPDVHRPAMFDTSPSATPPQTMGDMVRLNVGGSVFLTQRSTLQNVPDTRLSNLQETDLNFNLMTREWFFDRNPTMFDFILDYYRTDELHFPHNFCGPSIKKELLFWNVDEADISPCCWNRYREYEQEKKIFDSIDKAFESKTDDKYSMATDAGASRWFSWKKSIYIFMEEPMSSKPAKVWTLIFLLIVLTSIGILCIETHPSLRVPSAWENSEPSQVLAAFANNATMKLSNATYRLADGSGQVAIPPGSLTVNDTEEKNIKFRILLTSTPHPILENIDTFCTCFFTVEFLIRFVVCPNRRRFWTSPMNIIDILCVMPMWVRYIMILWKIRLTRKLLPLWFVIMILRVLRICRVLRLARHYTGVKILVLALRASLRELMMLLIFVFIVVMVFAVVIYYAEFFENDTLFQNIPAGYWWAIITLTTVGYGDMYPVSLPGYVVGAMCALIGILATGLPVPIIANNFNLYYTHAHLKEAVANRKSSSRPRRSTSSLNDSICGKCPEIGNANSEKVLMKEATV